jgi:hypothetical protein
VGTTRPLFALKAGILPFIRIEFRISKSIFSLFLTSHLLKIILSNNQHEKLALIEINLIKN